MSTADERRLKRNRRTRSVRPQTTNIRRISVKRLREEGERYPERIERPKVRADCATFGRPCPFVGCKYNLFVDVEKRGSIKFNFPDLEPHELKESCVLDIAERGAAILDDVGNFMNLTRERVRQIEHMARAKLKLSGFLQWLAAP